MRMRRLLRWVLGLPSLVVLLLFALANRQQVRVSFDPLAGSEPLLALEVPLWLVFFAGVLVGLLAGGIATWLRQSKWRRQARHYQHELELKDILLRQRRKEGKDAPPAPATAPDARATTAAREPSAPPALPTR